MMFRKLRLLPCSSVFVFVFLEGGREEREGAREEGKGGGRDGRGGSSEVLLLLYCMSCSCAEMN
jgi:hypothetical protein